MSIDWSNVLIALFGIVGTVGSPFLAIWLNERKEKRQKKSEDETKNMEKYKDLLNAFAEFLEGISYIENSIYLFEQMGKEDKYYLKGQINSISLEKIFKAKENVFLTIGEREILQIMSNLKKVKARLQMISDDLNAKKEYEKFLKILKEALKGLISDKEKVKNYFHKHLIYLEFE